MGRKASHLKEEIVSSMEIPRDLAFQEAMVTVTGNNRLCIENYRNILEYNDSCILILTKNGRIRVCGSHLGILFYTYDEMVITGHIRELQFLM